MIMPEKVSPYTSSQKCRREFQQVKNEQKNSKNETTHDVIEGKYRAQPKFEKGQEKKSTKNTFSTTAPTIVLDFWMLLTMSTKQASSLQKHHKTNQRGAGGVTDTSPPMPSY